MQGSEQPTPEEYRDRGWWTGERLVDRFARFAQADPERLAIVDDHGETVTRGELWRAASNFARKLQSDDIRAGEVVMIYLPNSVQWQVVFLGCLQAGIVPATLPITTDRATLAHIYDLTRARAIVSTSTVRRRPTGDTARHVVYGAGRAGHLILLDEHGAEVRSRAAGAIDRTALPEGVSHLMFTSSTTGMPKAVMHTEDTLGSVNQQFAERFGITEDTPLYMPSPLGHASAPGTAPASPSTPAQPWSCRTSGTPYVDSSSSTSTSASSQPPRLPF